MTRYTGAALYIGTLMVFGTLAGRRWSGAVPADGSSPLTIESARRPRADPIAAILDSVEDRLVSNDPFRLANAPASVRYDPSYEMVAGGGATFVAPPLRPTLVLKAIVGGPPWQAIIDGVPGQPLGTVAHVGSTFDRLTVRAVTRDSVIVQGPDTSWVLSFRQRP